MQDSGQLFVDSGDYMATLTATENAAHPCGLTVMTTTLALPLLPQQRYYVVTAEQEGALEAKLVITLGDLVMSSVPAAFNKPPSHDCGWPVDCVRNFILDHCKLL